MREAPSGERPDRERWGDPANYRPQWVERSRLAASLVKDGASVLEIGVGTGVFRDLVSARTAYVGADLEPLDPATIPLDLDRDELPDRPFDYVVLLGVVTYLHRPGEAAGKICGVADRIVVSYCCRRAELTVEDVRESRRSRGWLNDFTQAEFVALFARHGFELASSTPLAATEGFEEFLMEFRRRSGDLSPREVFRDLCLADEAATEVWSRMPRASARNPVALAAPADFAALSVSTENLGDHIQILAGLRLLSHVGITPTRYIDRDHEIASAPGLAAHDGPVGILLNGWFKSNRSEWPPHPKLAPLLLGFHIRLFQCPELVSDASIDYFRRHEPIGCRDAYTENLLRSKGVDAFTSHCLSLTLPRRTDDPRTQTEVFVVSRDERIRDLLPDAIGPYTFVSHYSGSSDFDANMARAAELLETYRTRAKLLVTTLLHCALPAIAMGIPVVVFYPINDETLHASDRERFSSLESLVRVHRLDEMDGVDWNPAPVDASAIKRLILDRFYEMAGRWAIAPPPPMRSAPT